MENSIFLEEAKRLCEISFLNPNEVGNNADVEKIPPNLIQPQVNLAGIPGFNKGLIKEIEKSGKMIRNLLSQRGNHEKDKEIIDIINYLTHYMESLLQVEIMVTKTRRKFVVHNGFVYEEKTKS